MELALASQLKNYNSKWLISDIIAGITVAIVLIPQGIAYSMLAGLDPIYGLYAAVVPLFVYALFSSSKYLSIGPVALMSVIVLGGVSTVAEPGSQEYISMVILASFLAGLLQIAFSFFRLGNLTIFLSKSVITGFITAAGIIIIISQLKYIFSLDLPRRASITEMIVDLVREINQFNWISLLLGLGSMFTILFLKKINKIIPSALLVIVIGSILVYTLHLDKKGVPIIGNMPTGFPSFSTSFLSLKNMITIFPTSLIIALIGFIGSYSISKSIDKVDSNKINPDKELFALGFAKVVGSFFLAMPSTGSFTRSAINYEAGAKTQVSSIITGIIIILTLLFLGQLFYYLPEPILAAIVITSVFSLIDIKKFINLYRLDKRDFTVLLITFLATLLIDITNGVLIGILASFFDFIYRTSKPNFSLLGKLPNTNIYRNIRRYPDAIVNPKVLILRFSQSLYFANAKMIEDAVKMELNYYPQTKYVIISFRSYSIPDATATEAILEFVEYCKLNNLRLVFTDLTGPLRDYVQRIDLYEKLGKTNFYLTVKDAVDAIEHGEVRQLKSIDYSSQTNYKK